MRWIQPRSICLAIVASLLVPAAPAQNSPLDAPLASKPPTVGSEIKRGYDAAFDCHIKFDPLDVERPQRCFDSAHSDNRQRMGQGFEAFDVGLFFSAAMHYRMLLNAQTKTNTHLLSSPMVEGLIRVYWVSYIEARKAIHIEDTDVVQAVHGNQVVTDLLTEEAKIQGND